MCYTSLITSGIEIDCDFSVGKKIGVDKDLILVNYSDFNREGTLDESTESSNRELTNDNNNIQGLYKLKFNENANLYGFKGKQNSVVPSFSTQKLENDKFVFTHSLNFTVYNKTSQARQSIMELSEARVIAITIDRSTGLYEIFGVDRGLKVDSISREYFGSQSSNYFQITLSTPSSAVLKELRMPELASLLEIEGESLYLEGDIEYEL